MVFYLEISPEEIIEPDIPRPNISFHMDNMFGYGPIEFEEDGLLIHSGISKIKIDLTNRLVSANGPMYFREDISKIVFSSNHIPNSKVITEYKCRIPSLTI